MGESAGIGGNAGALWYRVLAVSGRGTGGTAASDYASVLPAALHAARHRRPFIAGWLSRGGGAPLELITTAGPLPEPGRPARPASQAGADPAGADSTGAGSGAPDSTGPGSSSPASSSPDRTSTGVPAGAVATGQGPHGSEQRMAVPVLAPADRHGVELLFPWGARGVPIDGNMLADLDQLVWAPCPGRQVPLGDDALWPHAVPQHTVPQYAGGPVTAAPDRPTL